MSYKNRKKGSHLTPLWLLLEAGMFIKSLLGKDQKKTNF